MTIPPAYIKEKMKNVSRERNQETAIDEKKSSASESERRFLKKVRFSGVVFLIRKPPIICDDVAGRHVCSYH